MKKYLIPSFFLVAYTVILIKVMVFKDIPLIKVGQLMLNFGGTNSGQQANLIPFKTILPYLLGSNGLLIGSINLIGNVILLIPLGFLLPLVYPYMSWKKSVVLGIVVGLTIEIAQTVLKVGIFDIDDVVLNALGVVIGYLSFVILSKWVRENKYMNIAAATILLIILVAGAFYIIYPFGQPVINGGVGPDRLQDREKVSDEEDLCGGTGGNGEIVSIQNNSFTLELNNGNNQIINLTSQVEIHTPAGPVSVSGLSVGDRVTLVGGPEADGSFTAEAVFVCSSTL